MCCSCQGLSLCHEARRSLSGSCLQACRVPLRSDMAYPRVSLHWRYHTSPHSGWPSLGIWCYIARMSWSYKSSWNSPRTCRLSFGAQAIAAGTPSGCTRTSPCSYTVTRAGSSAWHDLSRPVSSCNHHWHLLPLHQSRYGKSCPVYGSQRLVSSIQVFSGPSLAVQRDLYLRTEAFCCG